MKKIHAFVSALALSVSLSACTGEIPTQSDDPKGGVSTIGIDPETFDGKSVKNADGTFTLDNKWVFAPTQDGWFELGNSSPGNVASFANPGNSNGGQVIAVYHSFAMAKEDLKVSTIKAGIERQDKTAVLTETQMTFMGQPAEAAFKIEREEAGVKQYGIDAYFVIDGLYYEITVLSLTQADADLAIAELASFRK